MQKKIKPWLKQKAKVIAVSKTKPISVIRSAHRAGQIDFGENYIQEFLYKASELSNDIRWHFIGKI